MGVRHASLAAWWTALKPASWAKLLVPMVLGQAIGSEHAGGMSWLAVLFGLGFTLALLVFVVLLNDYGDRRVDGVKRRMYPEGCSPKTIPDGLIAARSVRNVGLGAGVLALAVAVAAEASLERSGLTLGALLCLGLFLAYTFPPLRLNYRGGGELLEMIGVGLVLPGWNAWLQGGVLLPEGWVLLPGFCLLAGSSALGSGLADERSDAVGGKRTVVVSLGNACTKRLVEGLVGAAVFVWALGACLDPERFQPLALVPAVAWLAGRLWILHRLRSLAVTDAFRELRRWKAVLNGMISTSGTWIALVLVLRVVGGRE